MQTKYLVAGAVLLLLTGGAYYLSQNPPTLLNESPEATSTPQDGSTATSTLTATTTPQKPKPDFAAYPEHDIPEGARVIDTYFYTYNGVLFLNSVQASSSMIIQDVAASSFKRLTEFSSLANPNITLDCTKAGTYAFYTDTEKLFFYQIWLNSKFKKHRFETVIGATPEKLEILNSSSFRAEPGTYHIDYTVGTTSCAYMLKLQP